MARPVRGSGRVARVIPGLLAAALLAACVEPLPPPDPGPGDCGAAGLQDLVGRNKSVLAAMTFPSGTRIIGPGTAVTEDYSASRLNIDVSPSGRISRVWCG